MNPYSDIRADRFPSEERREPGSLWAARHIVSHNEYYHQYLPQFNTSWEDMQNPALPDIYIQNRKAVSQLESKLPPSPKFVELRAPTPKLDPKSVHFQSPAPVPAKRKLF
jgi:hypothetical protein